MAFFALLTLSCPFSAHVLAGPRDHQGIPVRIVRINDGDTVTIAIGRKMERVRLIGIDAPELGQRPWGKRAKSHLERMLPRGESAILELDVAERDKYGRLLGYIRTADGRLINLEMVRDGYAVLFTIPPNVRYVNELREAQDAAKMEGVGIWGKERLSEAPSSYRKKHPR